MISDPAHAHVPRLPQAPTMDPDVISNWERAPWRTSPELVLTHHMGQPPVHRPRTAARLGWDAEAVYVIFRVEDHYVRAVARHNQDSVCTDSCVEFFFVPGEDVANGYFNLEINCGGTVLFHYQDAPGKNRVELPAAALATLTVQHSLPRRVEPEIQEPVTWCVECRIPLAILDAHRPVIRPAPGATWRANLYKCGDNTSHPHWLTWSLVVRPKPAFHVPEQFGRLTFV